MKKICLFMIMTVILAASANAIDVYVDGDELETDVPAQIVDGRTMIPIAPIFKALNTEITWNNTTKTATGTKSDIIVQIQVGNKTAYVNGQPITLDVPAQIIDGRTMVPLAFISQALGANVYWDNDTASARIVTKLYQVLRVVDGDTIVVDDNGNEEVVHMIGVDAPEIAASTSAKRTDAGYAAYVFTAAFLNGEQIEIELDTQERTQKGELLAYVYSDGKMFNKRLLETGYADLDTNSNNIKHYEEFIEIVNNRDSSIPSDEYYSGYMRAPKAIYTMPVSKNKMETVPLFDEGKIIAIENVTLDGIDYIDRPCLVLQTSYGFLCLLDETLQGDFSKLRTGNYIKVGFIYMTYSPEDNGAYGICTEIIDYGDGTNNSSAPSNTAPLPNSTNQPSSTQSNTSNRQTVYVTKTGKKYHYSSTCNGGKYYPSTLSEALSLGLTPCNKCVH